MKVLTVSVTEPGRRLARRLPYPHRHGDAATVRAAWAEADALVLVLAVGAAVRIVAPLLDGKEHDPAVVCVDDAGRFAVPLCGGHRGANDLATAVAGLLGATPVVTTATDRLGVAALDTLPGLVAEGDVAGVTAAVLAGEPLDLRNQRAWPLPDALTAMAGPGTGRAVVEVSDADEPGAPGKVVLHPPSLVVGLGCSTDAGGDEAVSLVEQTLAGLAPSSVAAVATIERRLGHPAVAAVAARLGVPVVGLAPEALAAVPVPHPSEVVRRAVGTPSVCEAAALAAGGPGSELAVAKATGRAVTAAVARRARPPGSLSVVGLGPGSPARRTPEAVAAVRHAEVVLGYSAYVDQCADLLAPAQRVERYPLGAELERARRALDLAAAGRTVALVCSGDAGVYAMASPLLEVAAEPGYAAVEVTVVPGVTASLAAAALLGAPLGHDHAVVSLSDLHTPWEAIEARVAAAAAADLVLVLYNPRSARRTWQLEKARGVLLGHRPPTTPVGLVTDAGRPGQRVVVTTLADMDLEEVTMTTCVVIGSTTTVARGHRMVTPRGYDR